MVQAAVTRGQVRLELRLEPIEQHLGIGDGLVLGHDLQLVEDGLGGGHAHIGPDQRLLQLVPRGGVDGPGADRGQVAAERAPGLGQPLAEAGPDRRGERRLDGRLGRLELGLGDPGSATSGSARPDPAEGGRWFELGAPPVCAGRRRRAHDDEDGEHDEQDNDLHGGA